MTDSAEREREFHNEVFAHDSRHRAAPFYSITTESKTFYSDLVLDDCRGLHVLEYGCGRGSMALPLAKAGAEVVGIDISDEAVRLATEQAEHQGVQNVTFQRMDAHALDFDSQTFDRVCGSGILHHLRLETSLTEIARVLKPRGNAVFFEPLGHNPVINWYRTRTPELRTPDEHPLMMRDIDAMGEHFETVDSHFFHLTSLAAVPLRETKLFPTARSILHRIDQRVFRSIPWLSRLAWIVVVELRRPRTDRSRQAGD